MLRLWLHFTENIFINFNLSEINFQSILDRLEYHALETLKFQTVVGFIKKKNNIERDAVIRTPSTCH